MKREYDVKREMLLVFRNIVVSLFKGKDVFRIRRQFLGKGISLVFRTCAKVYPGLTKDDVFIMLLVRMSFKNTEIARLLHVKPASFRLRRWRLKKKLGDSGMDLRSMIMKL